MDEMIARNNGFTMGPRVPIGRRTSVSSTAETVKRTWDMFPSRVVGRSSSSTSDSSASTAACSNSRDNNTCEKPTNSSIASEITIGIVVPLAIIFVCVLIHFHRRNVKRQRQEDVDPHHRSLDFGLGDNVGDKSKRKSKLGMMGEKPKRTRGLSMDMNLSSPYLLPDHVQGSRESMSSLAKTLHQADDPYRPVTNYMNENGSIRSFEKGSKYTPSIITTSTKRMSRQSYAYPMSPGFPQPPRQNSYPKSPLTPSAASSVTAVEDIPAPLAAKEPTVPEHEPMPMPPPQTELPDIPEIRQPAPVAQRGAPEPLRFDLETVPEPDLPDFSNSSKRESVDELNLRPAPATKNAVGLGLLNGPQGAQQSPPISEVNVGPAHQSVSAVIEHTEDYADFDFAAVGGGDVGEEDDEPRGRSRARESGLVVPQQNSKRLSVGLRPLPPDEVMESEDPETRANRIRSFYKEYFDDSKQDGNRATQYGGGDNNYMGDAAYFDPDSNQFIMPYAQPIGRRAMTPPPSGSRFPGPRGPGPRGPGPMGPRGPGPRGPGPRHHSGSISGMPRAGSAMSFGPRPGSSASARGPRSGSAMSGKPRKPMPPPAALSTLPTPSKLKDDFSLINAADFAPPESFSERAAGRSQSPLGERRAYNPKVPVASPLVSSFDEMAALPSP